MKIEVIQNKLDDLYKSGKISKSFTVTFMNQQFFKGFLNNFEFMRMGNRMDWFETALEFNEKANLKSWVSGVSNPYKYKILFLRKQNNFSADEYSDFVKVILSVSGLFEKVKRVEISKFHIIITFSAE